MLEHTLVAAAPHNFRTTEAPAEADGVTEAWLAFETSVGRGRGHLRLRDGKAWTLLTTLSELKGHEEQRGRARPEVLVVGGGQGGIALGARLRQLDVPAIVVDRHMRPGDQWRQRGDGDALTLPAARWGGYVSIDNIGHQLGDHEDEVRQLVLGLLQAGHEEQILLSQDVGQVAELRCRGGRGYTYLAETFLPALRSSGVTEDCIHTMTIADPRRWLKIAAGRGGRMGRCGPVLALRPRRRP
jgi:hypothetical protein